MGQAVGEILPLAIGVAISIVPIIAIILMLITPKAKGNGVAFLVGWLLGLVVVGTVVLVIANSAGVSDQSGPSTTVGWIDLVLGLLFLLLAVKQWESRPAPGDAAPMPKWMQLIDTFTPAKSLGLAALLSGVNPKNLVLSISAASTIAQTGLSGSQQAVVLGVFILIGSIGIIAPLVVYLAMGQRAAAILDGWKAFLASNDAAIMCVLFLVFGCVLAGKGIKILA
jgi:hypothetical protein